MSLSLKENHVEEGLSYLMEQYKDQPNIQAFLVAFLDRIQELEYAIWQVISFKDVDTAVGEQLDLIGRIVNRAREGRDDETYRLWLRAQVLINRSSGTPEEMLSIARLVTRALPNQIILVEWYPARFAIYLDVAISDENAATLLELLILAKVAGVAVFLEYSTSPSEETFSFEGGGGLGFGDSGDPSVGGVFSSVIGLPGN